jgi:hypothetical protein
MMELFQKQVVLAVSEHHDGVVKEHFSITSQHRDGVVGAAKCVGST